jgi:predicted DNA repair protein MutK
MPPLITVLLVLGGLFLCFEGFEKVSHKFFHSKKALADEHQAVIESVNNESIDIVALEKEKIKGAIRTDFILSAEIVVIALGTVKEAAFETQVMVISALAIAITVGVYGLVAAIVKLDDLGLYLLRKSVSGRFNTLQRAIGRGLLIFAPFLMRLLTVVGTIAMFLVGGGIIVHSFSWLSQQFQNVERWLSQYIGSLSEMILPILLDGITGVVIGGVVLACVSLVSRLKKTAISH